MPRKAIVAGVFWSGLLLAGCEWCGNCKGLCGKDATGSCASAPPRSSGATAGNPIISSPSTPSANAAKASDNRFATTGPADSKGGIVPASGTSGDPSWSRKPSESWGGSSGAAPYPKPARERTDSDVPAPEDPETRSPALEGGPSLQRPSSPGTRPNDE